ncbi:unnamed protein product [Didymodactylos carnosus]|uniref:COP9 signalosome complex subunit 6 n=1 Tax=Didymodactylos carnosus TaxID=1234261 RepID=A0A813RF64_9BILA|nr:unnamed protein product [Didymodactylos carnosus]CAF1256211.1 unnamed protein product [Didymodactylos carnosus]CAF3566983.1 unnamed protein product [Didymodactylos carnosus]CAF4063257.1 unnamed protein product [Didymodactylos carnosus]
MNPSSTTPKAASAASSVTLSLHPLVIMNIAEHYTRVRVQNQSRPQGTPSLPTSSNIEVFGALLGKHKGRHIELCDTFEFKIVVNKPITNGIIIDLDYLSKKLESIKLVQGDLDFSGWYAIDSELNVDLMCNLHQQLVQLNESPLLLRLDPFGVSNELPVHVYETIIDILPNSNSDGTKIDFIETTYTLVTEEAERIGIDHVARYSVTDSSDTSVVTEQIHIQYNAIRLLYQRMLLLLEYVKAIKNNTLPRNDDLLREIGSLCQRLPIINTEDNNNPLFRDDFNIQQSDVALLALLACCTQEINTLNNYITKFNVVHEKQSHGGVFGYSGRRAGRGSFFYPSSFV